MNMEEILRYLENVVVEREELRREMNEAEARFDLRIMNLESDLLSANETADELGEDLDKVSVELEGVREDRNRLKASYENALASCEKLQAEVADLKQKLNGTVPLEWDKKGDKRAKAKEGAPF
jgi:chromosome segregation ATPase